MNLKGAWDSETTYSVGDVVQYTNGEFYHLQNECAAGITPIDTLYWGPLSQVLAQAAQFALDAAGTVAATVPRNISNEAITLSTETADYLITVDDSGETPELEVTAITEEDEEDEVEGDS